MEAGRRAGAVGSALRRHLGIRSVFLGLSERLLGLQSARLAIAVRVRRVVRARWRQTHVAHPVVADHAMDLLRLSVRIVLCDADLVRTAVGPRGAAPRRAMDVSDRQDRSGRAAVCSFPGARCRNRALPAYGLAEVAGGAALHALISLGGILIMCGMAWIISWYKHVADKSASRKVIGANADMAGGG